MFWDVFICRCLITLQGVREVREDGWLCNALHPLDISGASHVKTSEPEKDETQDDGGEDHPEADGGDDSQDAENCQTKLQ